MPFKDQDKFFACSKSDNSSSVDFSGSPSSMQKVYASSFISSFISSARSADLFSSSLDSRCFAWSNWMVSSLNIFKGLSDRDYVGVVLPAKFYDSFNPDPSRKPHLEIPERVFNFSTPFFPYNLALAGNALLSPSWIISEVLAVKKVLFSQISDVSVFANSLHSYRSGLVSLLVNLSKDLESSWSLFESSIVANPEVVSDIILQGFSSNEVAEVLRDFPFNVTIVPESKFASSQNRWISRRVGVWQVNFTSKNSVEKSKTFGVITPRITFNSLFNDSLYDPEKESTSALLVRVLLLRSLTSLYSSSDFKKKPLVAATDNLDVSFFRPVPARDGAKLPHASIKAAVAFVQTFSNPDSAYAALSAWTGSKYVLTVSKPVFVKSFNKVRGNVARLEEPSRVDVDNILPLCWGNSSKVVRISFIYN